MSIESAPLPEPTTAAPGSDTKVAIFESRYSEGLALFHPEDEQSTNILENKGRCTHGNSKCTYGHRQPRICRVSEFE